ncbi:MAG TPA: hypothetical protein OIM48_05645 [Clostridiaceae bacterium]|nr:hypothetical protein [Clostridium sp.]HJJ12765.1 hypothetical protein [Clostridiaceae bacterium]
MNKANELKLKEHIKKLVKEQVELEVSARLKEQVELEVNARLDELKAELNLPPVEISLKQYLINLGVGKTRWGKGLECTLFAIEYYHANNVSPGKQFYKVLEENGFSERELRSAKEAAFRTKTPLYKRIFERFEGFTRAPTNTQFVKIVEGYYYSTYNN